MLIRKRISHTENILCLASQPSGPFFASGSADKTVVIWSNDTLEACLHIRLEQIVDVLVFGHDADLYIGLSRGGLVSFSTITKELKSIEYLGYEPILALAIGMYYDL